MSSTKLDKKQSVMPARTPFSFSYKYFVGIYFLMTWLGLFPSVIFGYFYFVIFPFSFDFLHILLLIPLFLVLFGLALLSSLISTKVCIWIIHKRVAYPKIGTYPFTMADPQVRAWVLKGNVKNFSRWLFYLLKSNRLMVFWMRQMGVKVGKNVKVGQFVDDEEFLEIGDNTFMADFVALTSHMIDHSYFTILSTKVGKNCIFDYGTGGAGGVLNDNSYFKPVTAMIKGNICRGNAIYKGIPPKKVGEFSDLSPEDIKNIKSNIRKLDKKNFVKEKNAPIKISEFKLNIMKILTILGGFLIAFLFLYPYLLFYQALSSPNNHLLNILLLIPAPLFFLITIAAFIVGVGIMVKIFLIYYDRKGEIPEGWYELDDPRTKWFKYKYCLRMFGLKLFHGTQFRITDTFAMRFWGNVKLGHTIKLDLAVVDPQYLEVDDYSHVSALSRIHTHDIIDGKLYIQRVIIGKNVLLGGFTHVKPGVEIADGSMSAIGAWFRKNRKCKRAALWIGKPVVEFPIETIRKALNVKDKYID